METLWAACTVSYRCRNAHLMQTILDSNLIRMRNLRNVILLLVIIVFSSATTIDMAKEYNTLDDAIAHSHEYLEQRERTIGKLTEVYRHATSPSTRYELAYQLYEAYKPYCSDSAFYYIEQCIRYSDDAGKDSQAAFCRAKMAHLCSTVGMYTEAIDILKEVDPEKVDRSAQGAYYVSANHLYNNLGYHTSVESLRQRYYAMSNEYEGKVLETLPSDSPDFLERLEVKQRLAGQLDASLATSNRWLKSVEQGSHPYAVMAFYRYIEYKDRKDTLQMMHWVTESALADIRNGVLDQGAMWELASRLLEQGDVDRAYHYISFAADCANRFGTRMRMWQIAPIETLIEKSYQEQNDRSRRQLLWMLSAISALALFLLALVFYIFQQRKRLELVGQELKGKNGELEQVNSRLSDSNDQLRALNTELSSLNMQLAEANNVKEEYVGRFIRLCSIYIDKIDGMRKRIHKMVKNREYEELYRMTRSQEFTEKELDELYENFDTAFLHLFPNFVDDFNSLLRPEERMETDRENRLNTSLRIFALIRLGIEDSSKIAEFLHYSVNTIYNYRARVKNGALTDRDNFEQHVKEIGLPRKK